MTLSRLHAQIRELQATLREGKSTLLSIDITELEIDPPDKKTERDFLTYIGGSRWSKLVELHRAASLWGGVTLIQTYNNGNLGRKAAILRVCNKEL